MAQNEDVVSTVWTVVFDVNKQMDDGELNEQKAASVIAVETGVLDKLVRDGAVDLSDSLAGTRLLRVLAHCWHPTRPSRGESGITAAASTGPRYSAGQALDTIEVSPTSLPWWPFALWGWQCQHPNLADLWSKK
jgi:hypothetical protein